MFSMKEVWMYVLMVDIADRFIDRSETKREKDIRIDKSLFI